MNSDAIQRLFSIPLTTNLIISGVVALGVWWKFYKLDVVDAVKNAVVSEKKYLDNLAQGIGRDIKGKSTGEQAAGYAKGAGFTALEVTTAPLRFTLGLVGVDIGHASDWFK